MILDGDILEYFEHIECDVETEISETSSLFTLQISFTDFTLTGTFCLDREMNLLDFVMELPSPKDLEDLPNALNVLNSNSHMLKAYYNAKEDHCYIGAVSFVTEENIISTIDYILTTITDIDVDYIENLYYTVENPLFESIEDDDFDEKHENTSIEEDMRELMSLLNNKNGL